LENGKKFVINAGGNSDTNFYIANANLNGKAWDKNWIDHSLIQSGGSLTLTMSPTPNKERGTKNSSFPFSLSE